MADVGVVPNFADFPTWYPRAFAALESAYIELYMPLSILFYSTCGRGVLFSNNPLVRWLIFASHITSYSPGSKRYPPTVFSTL